jgi:hypothetical protein
MRPSFVLLWLIALASCAPVEVSREALLMDEIESSIRLPPNARSLGSYARYYTEDGGVVHGAYTTEVEEPRPRDFGCSEIQSDFRLKEVACPALADVPVGQRRWVKFEDYPAVSGRDCTAIQVVFDPRAKRFDHLQCVEPLHDETQGLYHS